MYQKLLIILFSMLTLVGCGSNSGNTNAKLTLVRSYASSALDTFSGGLMIYGMKQGSPLVFSYAASSSTETIEIELENGVWDIHAIGWIGDSLVGNVKCGKISGIELKGGDADLSLSVANEACNTPFWRGSLPMHDSAISGQLEFFRRNDPIATPLPDLGLRFESCSQIGTDEYGKTVPANDLEECHISKKGYAQSYQVVMPDFRPSHFETPDLTGNALVSPCLDNVDHATRATKIESSAQNYQTNLNIPVGPHDQARPFYTVVRAYYGPNCTDQYESYIFPKGLNYEAHKTDRVLAKYNVSNQSLKLFLKSSGFSFCEKIGAGTIPELIYPGVTNSESNPYIICSKEHLQYLSDNWDTPSYMSNGNFRLGRDINLEGIEHAQLGGDPEMTAIPFSGIFDGDSKTIFNMKIAIPSSPMWMGTGFIRKNSGTVRNLNFVTPDISGDGGFYVGVVAGENAGVIKNVHILAPLIDLPNGQQIGGITGKTLGTAASIEQCSVKEANILAATSIGGVVGSIPSVSLSSLSILNKVYASGKVEGTGAFVGGLVGNVGSCGGEILSQSAYKGDVLNTDMKTGGLIGFVQATTGCSLSNVYAHATVAGSDYVGGLIGSGYSTSFQTNFAYFSGTLAGGANTGALTGDMGTADNSFSTAADNDSGFTRVSNLGDPGHYINFDTSIWIKPYADAPPILTWEQLLSR